jgi:four helix bundle protein
MSSYRDLEVYKLSKELVIKIHNMTLSLPKFEAFEEGSQIRRSSKSIAAGIVEGYGRSRYKVEFIKYLTYAHAECDETILHLEFLFESESLKDKILFESSYDQLGRKLNKYIQWVESNWNSNAYPATPNP